MNLFDFYNSNLPAALMRTGCYKQTGEKVLMRQMRVPFFFLNTFYKTIQ